MFVVVGFRGRLCNCGANENAFGGGSVMWGDAGYLEWGIREVGRERWRKR